MIETSQTTANIAVTSPVLDASRQKTNKAEEQFKNCEQAQELNYEFHC